MMKAKLFAALIFCLPTLVNGQNSLIPLGELSNRFFERETVLSGNVLQNQLGIFPIKRKTALILADTLLQEDPTNKYAEYLLKENIEFDRQLDNELYGRAIWNTFYKVPGRFLFVDEKDFGVIVNPILYLKYSNKQDSDDPVFQNTRGITIRGHVDDKVFFESSLFENQASFADYVERRMERDSFVIGNGFNKTYTSDVFNINQGYDYLNATGTIGFNLTRSIAASVGYDRNFIGHGYRSLLLGDFSNNYFHLKFDTRVWKLRYQNIFAQFFNNGSFSSIAQTAERKYLSLHHLSFNPSPNFQIGLFEAVVYSGSNGLELPFLNPIIFYRSIEGFANREGNAMLGADLRINVFKRFSLYGQFVLDEFKFNEVFGDPPGWWANKFGVQLGAKYFNALNIKNLDVQLEYNTVRPYTYGHRTKLTSYSHFNQPLAHPLGANFREAIAIANYQFNLKWFLEARLLRMSYGEDTKTTNWGSNILKPSGEREQEYNNKISQGIDTDVWLANVSLSYMFGHDLFLDLEYNLRRQMSDLEDRRYTESYIGFAVRLNIAKQRFDL